jgi:AraC family transcriptional activator FtrA
MIVTALGIVLFRRLWMKRDCPQARGGAQLAELTRFDQIMPTLRPRSRGFNPLVVALAYDGLCAFEFACTAEVFGLPRPEFGPGWYRFQTCSLGARRIRGQYGVSMSVDGGLERLAEAGTIMIPGWQGIDVAVPGAIVQALRAAHDRGTRLLSICSGSFVLAATGLLDGKRATTHWRYAAALQNRYPQVRVDPQVLYIDEGQILTSAGSAAGLDLCLHLIRRDYGADVANQVARRLVVPPHRDGGQAQFLDNPVDRRERGPLCVLLERVQRRIHQPITISAMARWAAMSERTFMRRFRATTGMTPGDWITHVRVDRAKDLLERSSLAIDQVASQSGLGTATTMRHHFRKRIGLSPVEYRKRFSQVAGRAS